MKFPTWRRPYTLAVLLGSALAFIRCGHETLAGSSVTTGNPTEIQVSFTGENGPVALTGRVEIYGATQVPIPGFQPEPLASIDVAGQQDILLDSNDFAGIADSLWPAGSLEGDSLARFNLVFKGEGQGAILSGLAYRPEERDFPQGKIIWERKSQQRGLIKSILAGLTRFDAYIKPSTLDPERNSYLFLPGTGFKALSDSGRFTFPALPMGAHSLSFISLPDRSRVLFPEDTAFVYGVDRSVVADRTDTLSISDMQIQVPMPDAYKPIP